MAAAVLGELVTETTDAVVEVRQAYESTDQAVADAMNAFQQPLTTIDHSLNDLIHAA